MSNILDEVTIARKRKRRRYHLRRLVAVLTLIAVVVPAVILIDQVDIYTFRSLKDFFNIVFAPDKGYPAMLNSSKPLQAHELKGATAVLTTSELILKADRGAELFRHTHGYTNPLIDTGKTRMILYDSGNRSYSIYNRSGELYSAESEYPLVSAAMASNGTVAILTRGERSLSQLEILSNKDYLTSFTWYGVSGFPLYCSFSNDSKEVYAVTVSVAEDKISSIITFIEMDKRVETATVRLNGIILKVFEDRAGYTAVTDSGVFLIDKDYIVSARYMTPRTPIIGIAKTDGYLALAFGDNRRTDVNSIVILNSSLEKITQLENVGAIDSIYMTPDYLWLLSSGKVYGISPSGEYRLSCDTMLRSIDLFTVRNKLFILLHDRIEPLEPTVIKEDLEKREE